ncbi:ATP-dependent helicase [Maridesulfovibrio salexigens]|uniref:DNA 3'-5' helicase n=1 Tax=Maridesulfovibrio salexigens (strain ATCC 14822 / DSM 2638 / NCIMB 8403 / VKM B-1763) TaxID=526222 RepID=C6BX85_MARSD|nr:ATP-dependent helicase [Maridesulfovibrio salexigens]ACS80391.1 UvrD/REP helicase [Maridesulfovibrio salexigens DSM 2638]
MIDFKNELNPAQYEAATHPQGPVLVIAGAGSGKTRTIVYRLAWLVEQGIPPESILLMTFTRKAAQEMLQRTELILGRNLHGTQGGTFHAFAYSVLRQNAAEIGFPNGITLMDRSDSEAAVKEVKDQLKFGKGDRSYPKKSTLLDMISKSRNKELSIDTLVNSEAFHLATYASEMEQIAKGYAVYKKQHGLMDYDDLLFYLEELLTKDKFLRNSLRSRYQYIMVDEYQDTNLVQARIVGLLAGKNGNVMAVGDDAQSIYSFRGADVTNILKFPDIFEDVKIVRLEQNYRSTQPILDLTNAILDGAETKFDKKLFTEQTWGDKPQLMVPLSDFSQSNRVLDRIIELQKKHGPEEVAVLFRAGYQSYGLEVALKRLGVGFKKYGGLKFNEAAHIKDVLAFMRLVSNPADIIAWQRTLGHIKGVGPKTATKIAQAVISADQKALGKFTKKYQLLQDILRDLDGLRKKNSSPATCLEIIVPLYRPLLVAQYPDDYPRREAGIEQLSQIASNYDDLEFFLTDLCLDPDQHSEEEKKEDVVTLSTIHSAKGLEWNAVIIIDLVEDRFPSRKSMQKPQEYEEERRLLYVACTRARKELIMCAPASINRKNTDFSEPAVPSPFLRELDNALFDELQESYSGGMAKKKNAPVNPAAYTDTAPSISASKKPSPMKLGHCKHKIFGRGKIIERIEPNKLRINFPGFGPKVIVEDFVEML